MRRLLTALLAVALVCVVAGCSTTERGDLLPMGVSPSPVPTPDTAVTDHVCRDATAAVTSATAVFNAQLAAIDAAASANDQNAIVKAADTIQTRFLALAKSLSTWGAMPVRPPVRSALTHGAATLQAICAETYAGNQNDIARQLTDLSHTLTKACG